ncbi:MAG: ATP-dependent sacrificial sulfur transferase LarE [Clostridia bacterium]|nr:ATP-dependent sacrificial sulfur transferase LarE [Clostridia bacterium]MBR3273344.1 ATP-dependent sacrificial sulfur transferase LarE [Clostridia bacterium]
MIQLKAVPKPLKDFFDAHPRLALAFSGGVDSAYLLYAARACDCDVEPFYAQSAFQPEFERRDAARMAAQLKVPLNVVPLDVLAVEAVRANPANRCYYCKQAIFTALLAAARAKGYDAVMDGTNASDDAGDRPGMRALEELAVLSPLRLCGITKAQVRAYSRQAGLFTWDKPAYACLATRIPTGTPITGEDLARVEGAEMALFNLGFADFRVRLFHGAARLQLPAAQMADAIVRRDEIRKALAPWFDTIMLDLKDR